MEQNKTKLIELWRNEAVESPLSADEACFPAVGIFPKGRDALSECLRASGLGRFSRVAIPEWSSHCVISAVGKYSTPIPMRETIGNKISVDGVLLYEQWGWPFKPDAWEKARRYFNKSLIIYDRVDSADFFRRSVDGRRIYEIVSFSKLFGLSGGGLARNRGKYIKNTSEPDVDPKVIAWMKRNDLILAVDKEREKKESQYYNGDEFFPFFWLAQVDVRCCREWGGSWYCSNNEKSENG